MHNTWWGTITFCAFVLLAHNTFSQNVSGTVFDKNGPLTGANVRVIENGTGDVTDQQGRYTLELDSGSWTLQVSFVGYKSQTAEVTTNGVDNLEVSFILESDEQVLQQVEVMGDAPRDEAGMYLIEPKDVLLLPAASPDISRLIASLPGVFSNNELSSSYSVRGGNYDENLVYINDIPIYRPQLVRAGRQEGLNLINPELINQVRFSAGGWQPKYGDKLASVLSSSYDFTDGLSGSAMIGLLNASASVKGGTSNGKLNYFGGYRHRNLRSILGTFEVDGQYFPRYSDLQAGIRWNISDKTSLIAFGIYSRNRFLVEPTTQETDFGTFFSSLRFLVAFEGREELGFDTWQGAVRLNHQLSEKHQMSFLTSYVYSRERDYIDLEGGYRLCDIDNDPSSSTFNQCAVTRGIGTNYHYARNALDSRIINFEMRNSLEISESGVFEYGIGYERNDFDDTIDEYRFIDSARFVTITETIKSENVIAANTVFGYAQGRNSFSNGVHRFTYGLRFTHRDLSNQFLLSPRLSYNFDPDWVRNTKFRFSAGMYVQPAFYKEMRDFDGTLVEDQKAQTSWHFSAAMDHSFSMWGRPFVFVSEVYYRYLNRIIPYDMDNIRIRYYAGEEGKAFAYGFDARLSGEFISGLESWFSLGLLNTREDIVGDGRDFINRPTNQNLNLGIVFQDHLPNVPSFRVSLSLLYGSGLPFGPTNDLADRNRFVGESYNRVDLGFNKLFAAKRSGFLDEIVVGADILNLFGANNVISYNFIQDVTGTSFGIPNRLSQRFFNVWLRANF